MLFAGAVFLSSCASSGYHTAEGRKFDEAEFADLVLKYASDQTIFMVKPDGHEGAFYRIFNRDEICALDAQRLGRRDMAVVMIGFNRDLAVEQQIKEEWVSSLTKLNYHRVVFLRSSDHNEVNGLRVIEDRSLALSPERHELTFADAGVAEQRK
ncbi:MAG: hypothetical protein RLY20_748 [Verrucomicrobiota bacterium]|jgi:hypothetical protein